MNEALFFNGLFKFLANQSNNESKNEYLSKMDEFVNKFREETGLEVDYEFEDFRFEASIVNVSLKMKGFYNNDINKEKQCCDRTELIIYCSSGKTFKEAVENLITETKELDMIKIKNNLSKYTKIQTDSINKSGRIGRGAGYNTNYLFDEFNDN